jgi:succinate-semialdehyde dehydrogenase/glutarate-semialdehyde dehydrogenase
VTYVVTRNPATGEELDRYPAHDEAGVEQALADVAAAAAVWGTTPLEDRLALLRHVGKLLTERREEYAALITAEMGSPSPRRWAR